MAVNATAIYRVRTGGNNGNGGGYDSAISGAGTDYSQQDTAQLSLTDIACSATTTVTSATGGFTSAMIGNAIWITGGGATAGPYFITAYTDTNTITVDRTPGTVTAGTGKVGGAWANPVTNLNSSTYLVPGNIVYVRGSGSQEPSTIDYTLGASTATVIGSASTGYIRIVGENGRPLFGASGTNNLRGRYVSFENLGVKYTAATTTPCLQIEFTYFGRFENCFFDQDGYDTTCLGGIGCFSGAVIRCEFKSTTAKRTTNTNAAVILQQSYNFVPIVMYKCLVHDCIGPGISADSSTIIVGNTIVNNGTTGIAFTSVTGYVSFVAYNTIAGLTNGITIPHANILNSLTLCGNIIANCSTAGIAYSGAGSSAEATRLGEGIRFNMFYNNTSNATGMSLSSTNTTGTDPAFTNTSTRDYSVGASTVGLDVGIPLNTISGQTDMTNYWAVGSIQRNSSGTSGIIVHPGMSGGARG